MERVAVDEVDPVVLDDGTRRRGLADPLDTDGLAINRYRVPPGGGFAGGLHAHMDQEEVFVVLEGRATFETLAGEVAVGAGEAVRFAPGEFQSGRNDGDGPLVALAIGAPRETEDVRLPVACHACGFEAVRLSSAGPAVTFVCPECGAEATPDDCPACGHHDLRVALGDGADAVVVCQGCGATFDDPPLRD